MRNRLPPLSLSLCALAARSRRTTGRGLLVARPEAATCQSQARRVEALFVFGVFAPVAFAAVRLGALGQFVGQFGGALERKATRDNRHAPAAGQRLCIISELAFECCF